MDLKKQFYDEILLSIAIDLILTFQLPFLSCLI